MKKFLSIIMIGATLLSFGGCKNGENMTNTKIENFTTEKSDFKVGVISDTQLPPTKKQLLENDKYVVNFKKALTVLKNEKVDMILFAGDIGDLGTEFAFKTYKDTIEQVFKDDKLIVQTIMGNHDYWSKNALTFRPHKKAFTKVLSQSPWTHYVVNGYHFIGASPNSGNMTEGYKKTAKWLDEQLKIASKDSKNKPIFVVTHNEPKDTCYGADEWGDTTLDAVLSKYPNVVDFGGHSHYSVIDERSIWQGDYTVINTQSLSYTELETGKENGTIPPNADKTPMGYIMDFSENSIKIRRINFADGNKAIEEKQNMRWSFELPYANDKRYSFSRRKENNSAPIITSKKANGQVSGKDIVLNFDAANDDDFVHSYKVVIDSKTEKYFFSDFYNGVDNMKKAVTLTLKNIENPNAHHTIKIYAVDSWGAISKDYIELKV